MAYRALDAPSREPLIDEEDPEVNHDNSAKLPRYGSVAMIAQDQYYFSKPGIVVPPRVRFRGFLLCRWTLAIVGINILAFSVIKSMTTQTSYEIPAGAKAVSIHLEHCNLQIDEGDDSDTNLVTVQHWNFLGKSYVDFDGETVNVNGEMRASLLMFRCLVCIRQHNKMKMREINATVEGVNMNRVAIRAVPSERLIIKVHDASIFASDVAPYTKIDISHGHVSFHIPPKHIEAAEVIVHSGHASLMMTASVPMEVLTPGNANGTSVFSAPFVHRVGDRQVLSGSARHPLTKGPVKVTFTTDFEAAGYFLAKTQDGVASYLETSRGERQVTKPILTQEAISEMKDVQKWMDVFSQTSKPWEVRLRIRGPGLPCGSWRIVSSEAYFVVRLEWLALFSGLLLQPTVKQGTVQLLGMHEQWPPKGSEVTLACQMDSHINRTDPVLREAFSGLIPHLKLPEGSSIAWVPDGNNRILLPRTIIFKPRSKQWITVYHNKFGGPALLFLAAFALNCTASIVGSLVLVWFVRKFGTEAIMCRLNRQRVAVAASQRITQKSTAQSWKMFATQIDHPHGVLLRWTKRTAEQRPAFLWVYAVADEDPIRGHPYDEVCIERIKNEKVPSMKENNAISEFFFSADMLCRGNIYEPGQRNKALQAMLSYKFQVESVDANEDSILKSDWSNEVFIAPPSSVFEIPLLLVKGLCPVPTASLGYFLDHYAERHCNGKTPQQILVLSNISVEFHKNFKDLTDCDEDFYITAFAGVSREECSSETFTGRVTTFTQTENFQPPKDVLQQLSDLLEDEQKTVQLSYSKLRLGRLNDEVKQLTFRMHWVCSGEDVAEAKFDWADLSWEFEQVDEDGKPQYVEIDLVCENNLNFDEDYLVCLKAHVAFENSVDRNCAEIPRIMRFFIDDAPGQVFYRGMERFVTWDVDATSFTAEAFDLYVEYPDISRSWGRPSELVDSNPRILAKGIQRASVGVTLMMDFPETLARAKCTPAQIYAQDAHGNKVYSHRFCICQTWLLTEMEIQYASFCKMNGVSMQSLNEETLVQFGLATTSAQLKVLPDLRRPLPFESQDYLYENPGSLMVHNNNLTLKRADYHLGGEGSGSPATGDVESYAGGASGRAGMQSDGSKDKDESKGVQTFVVTSQRVQIMQSTWWRSIGACNHNWSPSTLLVYDFYPVDNLVNALATLCEATRINYIFRTIQFICGAKAADSLLGIMLAPLMYILPLVVESCLFLLQYCVFMSLPILPLTLATVLEYLRNSICEASRAVASGHQLEAALPDVMFRSGLSGTDMEVWLDTLPVESKYALLFSIAMYVVLLVFIMETNFMRDWWPIWLQTSARFVLNEAGSILVGFVVWIVVLLLCIIALWFMMAVVIYPEQMVVTLSAVGGLGFLGFSMAKRYQANRDQICSFLKEEVPDILDLMCDNFIREYDRQDLSGPNQARTRASEKLAEIVNGEMRKYLTRRFNGQDIGVLAASATMDENQLFRHVFDRALLSRSNWGHVNLETQTLTNTTNANESSAASASANSGTIKTTEQVLIESGLAQEDTSDMDHFQMRVRLADRETELRDKAVHQYSEDQRQKLMNVYVRMLQELPLETDVDSLMSDAKKLGRAIYRAQRLKMEIFNRKRAMTGTRLDNGASASSQTVAATSSETSSLMQLFVSDVNQQALKQYELHIASFLDEILDPATISEAIASYIWRDAPAEINKVLRLAMDEHCVGSAKQKVFENLHRWKSKILRSDGELGLRNALTLVSPGQNQGPQGIMKMLQEINVLHPRASVGYRQRLFSSLERKVNEWKDEDEEELIVDPSECENFVRELLSSGVWWGAVQEVLAKIGFPMFDNTIGVRKVNLLPVSLVMTEFEMNIEVQKNGGFLPKEKLSNFLCAVTRAGPTEGGTGRIWKAQMVRLMQKLEICGHVQCPEEGKRKRGGRNAGGRNQHSEPLDALALYHWPRWLRTVWSGKAPQWQDLDGRDIGEMNVFLPKSELHAFFQEVAFKEGAGDEKEHATKVDQEYDDWRKDKDDEGLTVAIWNVRGKAFHELRGIWQECFLKVLEKMNNQVSDEQKGIQLFELCRLAQKDDPQFHQASTEGLLHVNFLVRWLATNLVKNTGECSMQVFQKVLERCELSLPRIVVDNLWYSADPTMRFEGNWALRKVSDLEDRIVMYLVKGLPAEAVQLLIFDVLSLPSLEGMSQTELKSTFMQVDTKLGMNGFLEPREVQALIVFISQAGMSYKQLLESLKRFGCDLPESEIKEAFLVLDTTGDDLMDLPEYLGFIDYIIVRLIPQEILRVMGLQPQQVLLRIVIAFFTLVAVGLFMFVSIGAFHVEMQISSQSQQGGASIVRAGLAVLAVVAFKRETTEEDEERFFKHARERLYSLLGVTHSQIDARRRAMGIAIAGPSRPAGLTAGKNGPSPMKLKFGGGKRGVSDADEGDDDDGGDDD